MKKILLFFLVMSTVSFFFSQNHTTANGYKLKDTITFVYVYRDLDNKPDFSVRNRWYNRYWFVVDPTIKYKDPTTEETYIRITIPANKRYDDELNKWITNNAYHKQVKWDDEEYIDGSDFNS
ncbi:hypothetical protein [Chryseobacterium gleum]|uniref:hypothetical protein n=1 Tax=Chryseobacterium gleum TaxID=250 RepID=UPI00241CA4D4|nr:hypothetical protein [Chryseobacterium gleum]